MTYIYIYVIYNYIWCVLRGFRICIQLVFKTCSYSLWPLKLHCFLFTIIEWRLLARRVLVSWRYIYLNTKMKTGAWIRKNRDSLITVFSIRKRLWGNVSQAYNSCSYVCYEDITGILLLRDFNRQIVFGKVD